MSAYIRSDFTLPNIAEIITATETVTGITAEKILGRRRPKPISNARKIIYFLARKYGHSTPRIGARLGVDHGSVIVGSRIAVGFIERDAAFAKRVELVDHLARRIAADRRAMVAASVPKALREAA